MPSGAKTLGTNFLTSISNLLKMVSGATDSLAGKRAHYFVSAENDAFLIPMVGLGTSDSIRLAALPYVAGFH